MSEADRSAVRTAVKIAEIEGALKQMNERLHDIGTSISEVARLSSEIAKHQLTMETQGQTVQRAFDAIERYGEQFTEWRVSHEAENLVVANKVTTFRGVLIGFGLMATLLSGTVVAIAKQWVDGAAMERARIERQLQRIEAEADARLDVLEKQR